MTYEGKMSEEESALPREKRAAQRARARDQHEEEEENFEEGSEDVWAEVA